MGMGPMTGRAAGYCAGSTAPGFASQMPGRGFGGGFGRGRGAGAGFRGGRAWGMPRGFGAPFGFGAQAAPYGVAPGGITQVEALKARARYFEDALEDLKEQIAALEAERAAE